MASLEAARAIWKTLNTTKGFNRLAAQVVLTAASDGNCKAEFTVSEEMTNYGGTLHGGMTASLIDIVSTMGLMTSKRQAPGVTVNLNINYLKAAAIGEEILIDSKAVKVGKTLAFLDVTLSKKTTGEIVASGTHVKFIGG